MTIETWQVPLLVMGGIILLELVVGTMLRRWNSPLARKRLRTGALAVLAGLVVAVGVMTLGPDLADQLASVAAAVAAIVALWLTYRSFLAPEGTSDNQPPPAASVPPSEPSTPVSPAGPAADDDDPSAPVQQQTAAAP